jgi:2-polyprenyl-3-methyl-5-hydroxy-6-metoxy-1,4-benzoquinol methylase
MVQICWISQEQMMVTERNLGLRSVLAKPWIYDAFQAAVGASSSRKWLAKNHIRPESGMTVVDVGCGTGEWRRELPQEVQYFGFDPSASYIHSAQQSHTGSFMAGTIREFLDAHAAELAGKVDLVTCMGVLHHVSGEQMDEILEGAAALLKPNGRFCALEPAFLAKQDFLSTWVLKQDRGTSILFDVEWQRLLAKHFRIGEVQITNNLLRIPYVHALLTAWK